MLMEGWRGILERRFVVETPMRKTGNWLLGSAAIAGLAATAAIAAPLETPMHVLTVQLPGGGVEHIRYSGDVQPRVVVMPAWSVGFAPTFAPMWPGSAFAQMDRQMNAMMQQARAMQAAVQSGRFDAGFANVPPGGVGYSRISVWSSGNGGCMRTVEMTSQTGGARPQVVSNTSGNCGPAATTSLPASSSTIPAKVEAAPKHAGATRI
jgi:hypothetical protein